MATASNNNPNVATNNIPRTDEVPIEGNGRLQTKSRTGFVTVACKIPNGILLQLSTMEKNSEPVMGGGHRDVQIGRKTGPKYLVRGPRLKHGEVPNFVMAGGYALTVGVVPEDFWNEWIRQNHDADIVKRELIFAHKSVDDVESQAENNAGLLTGLEPLNPNALPRGIMTADEQKNRGMAR